MSTPDQIARFTADLGALGVWSGDRLAVAVSGGADSLALLLLAANRGDTVAATVDHGLRPAARDEAAMVAKVCEGLGVPHCTITVGVEDGGKGLQAHARSARYDALGRWSAEMQAAALATAHHVDDQAETFLMRAVRGAGVSGLSGVRRQRTDRFLEPPIVRPLLGWRRSELATIVHEAGLDPVRDPANADERFDRTRMRRLLEREPMLDADRIAFAAANLADAEEAVAWAADREYRARSTVADGCVSIDPAGLPHELLRRLVAQAMIDVAGAGRRVSPGPEISRMVARLAAGDSATLAGIKALPGRLWRFEPAPPHRSR